MSAQSDTETEMTATLTGGAIALGVLKRQVTLIPLIGLIYFSVSGGPYGLENAISSSGPGMALVLIVVVPIIFAIPCALMNAELGSALPLEGGYYYWVKVALGSFWAFVEGMSSWFTSFLDTALYPVLFVDYLATWFPGMARGQHVVFSAFNGGFSLDLHWAITLAFMAPLAYLNARGAKVVGETSTVLTVVILAPFVVLTGLGMWKLLTGPAGNPLHPLVLHGQSTFSAFSAGLAVVIWNYVGFDSITTASAEIVKPKRNYPLALAVCIPLIMISYLLPTLAALASGLHHQDPTLWTDGDFALAGQLLGGPWLKACIIGGAMFAQIGLFSSLLMSGSRIPAVLAADRYLPAALARTSQRYGTPVVAIVVSCAMFAVFCALDFITLLDAAVVLGFGGLFLEFVAFLVLRAKYPHMDRPFRVPGGWCGAILITALPMSVAAAMLWSTMWGESRAFWIGAAGVTLSAALYLPAKRWIKAGGPDAAVDVGSVDLGPGVDVALVLENRHGDASSMATEGTEV